MRKVTEHSVHFLDDACSSWITWMEKQLERWTIDLRSIVQRSNCFSIHVIHWVGKSFLFYRCQNQLFMSFTVQLYSSSGTSCSLHIIDKRRVSKWSLCDWLHGTKCECRRLATRRNHFCIMDIAVCIVQLRRSIHFYSSARNCIDIGLECWMILDIWKDASDSYEWWPVVSSLFLRGCYWISCAGCSIVK